MSGVFGKRDARAERQSSWQSALARLRSGLGPDALPLRLSFSGFVLWHFSLQAYRAASDVALPEAGFERAPGFVAALLVLLWLPFTAFGVWRLRRAFAGEALPAATSAQERALRRVEPVALSIVLLFGAVHGSLMAWPLLTGSLDEADLRAQLVAGLSGTWRGLPLTGIAYLCAVGSTAFYAARLTLSALPQARARLRRTVLALALLGYLLGSYAVIRCGTGSLLP